MGFTRCSCSATSLNEYIAYEQRYAFAEGLHRAASEQIVSDQYENGAQDYSCSFGGVPNQDPVAYSAATKDVQ
jgi:hypothetical protein